MTLPADLTAKTIPSTVDSSNITFYALQGKVSRLILTGHANDPITDATTLASGSRRVDFSTNNYFGSDIVFRNIDYRGSTIYMNGHSLFLNGVPLEMALRYMVAQTVGIWKAIRRSM